MACCRCRCGRCWLLEPVPGMPDGGPLCCKLPSYCCMREGGLPSGRAGNCLGAGGCLAAAAELGRGGGVNRPAVTAGPMSAADAVLPADATVAAVALLLSLAEAAAGCSIPPGSLPSLLPARCAGWACSVALSAPGGCSAACSCSRSAMALAARCVSVSTGGRRCCSAEAGRRTAALPLPPPVPP